MAKMGDTPAHPIQHYRCMKCYMPKTHSEINADTIVFIPKKIVFPNVKIDDFLIQAATDIVSLFTNPPTNMIPSLQVGDSTQNALLQ